MFWVAPPRSGCVTIAHRDASSFRILLLNDNKIGGPIPADLTKITGLSEFDGSTNKLTGTVPAAVTTAFVVGTTID